MVMDPYETAASPLHSTDDLLNMAVQLVEVGVNAMSVIYVPDSLLSKGVALMHRHGIPYRVKTSLAPYFACSMVIKTRSLLFRISGDRTS